jgi:tetratricopeptide (TPR) repeat protein
MVQLLHVSRGIATGLRGEPAGSSRYNRAMFTTLRTVARVVGFATVLPMIALAQDGTVRQLFESGQYQRVIDATVDSADPQTLYVAAQSRQRLGATDEARRTYGQLAARPEGDVWHFIGLSGQHLLDDQTDAALGAAQQAAATAGALSSAHYQVGLVQAKRREWPAAAEAFDRAAELDPSNAYSHYYSGLMHYQAGRPDLMAIQFEQFLRLAPEAPERPEVLQIMRTVRGR